MALNRRSSPLACGPEVLAQLTKLVEDVKIAETGFAFLSQQNGNVLTIPKDGEALLGLSEVSATGAGASCFPSVRHTRRHCRRRRFRRAGESQRWPPGRHRAEYR